MKKNCIAVFGLLLLALTGCVAMVETSPFNTPPWRSVGWWVNFETDKSIEWQQQGSYTFKNKDGKEKKFSYTDNYLVYYEPFDPITNDKWRISFSSFTSYASDDMSDDDLKPLASDGNLKSLASEIVLPSCDVKPVTIYHHDEPDEWWGEIVCPDSPAKDKKK